MQNDTHKFSLVEGIFDAEDAKEILLTLLNNKIKYHNERMFSHEERFNKPCDFSIKRKKELQQTYEAVRDLLNQYKEEGKEVSIHSDICITVKNDSTVYEY